MGGKQKEFFWKEREAACEATTCKATMYRGHTAQ